MSRPSITPIAVRRCFRRVAPISIPEKKIANAAASHLATGNICRDSLGRTGTAKDELGAAVCTVTETFGTGSGHRVCDSYLPLGAANFTGGSPALGESPK